MDERLHVTGAPREISVPIPLQMSLLAVGWRILRAEHDRRGQVKAQADAETERTGAALANLAEEVFRLKRFVGATRSGNDESAMTNSGGPLAPVVERMEAALAEAGVTLVAPEGQPYTDELLHLLENVAQRPNAALDEPHVDEVLVPAVVYRGSPLRMGKAVIAVPARDGAM